MKRNSKKSNYYIFVLIASVILVVFILWWNQFHITNEMAYKQQIETFHVGEMVGIGENFYLDAGENLDGYAVRVNGTELVDYQEYIELHGGVLNEENFSDEYPTPDYICLLHLTLKNNGNTDGSIPLLNYSLYDKSLNLSVDFETLELIDANFDGIPFIRLREDTEADVTIPFIPSSYDMGVNRDKVNQMIENDKFYLPISYFPIRKVIEVEF